MICKGLVVGFAILQAAGDLNKGLTWSVLLLGAWQNTSGAKFPLTLKVYLVVGL